MISNLIPVFSLLTTDAAAEATTGSMLSNLILPVAMLAILYFIMFRPQQKRQKEEAKMRSAVEVGDDIVTIGGIVGTVVSIKEDTLVIETGSDRSKMRVMRWSIQQNTTPKEDTAAEKGSKK